MQAIILAAGMGSRMGKYTRYNTKCMVEVNGTRLIDRTIQQLLQLNVARIIIVIGYKGKELQKYLINEYPDINILFVNNAIFAETNNIYSLWLAKRYLEEDDTILLESDLIFDFSVLESIYKSKDDAVALVSKFEPWMNGTMVNINKNKIITNFVPKKDFLPEGIDKYYKTVNIYKFSLSFSIHQYVPFLDAFIKAVGKNEYYEEVLKVITFIDTVKIKAIPISGMYWYEIDNETDLINAKLKFP